SVTGSVSILPHGLRANISSVKCVSYYVLYVCVVLINSMNSFFWLRLLHCRETLIVRDLIPLTRFFYNPHRYSQVKSDLDKKSDYRLKRKDHFGKKNRERISTYLYNMASPRIEEELAPLRAAVKEYGDLIRSLKEKNAPKTDIDRAVVELKARKRRLEERELALTPKNVSFFDRLKFEDLLKQRFFYDQSFAIYGGVTGLYDFGPMGCAMKANMINLWRNHFVLEENMLEVDCSVLTPETVLKASGHVDRFSDWMVKDLKTGECFRADHLIKNFAEKMCKDVKIPASVKEELKEVLMKLEGFNDADMHSVIVKHNIKSPITGNELSEPIAFNLMFPTVIGPTGDFKAYLRPETAQGIFVNFKRLLEFNQGKLPFAAAQIGSGFRNEISPRQGLIRLREFTMCEIEHFVDPNNKSHPKFEQVKDYNLILFSGCNQMDGAPAQTVSIGEAIAEKLVANETLGYYMVRVHKYLVRIGVDPERLRFRQHLANEMAHYACDCWDAEILTSYGWIECVGVADRACYDLSQHSKATGEKLVAEKVLSEPKIVQVIEAVPNKAAIGKVYKTEAKQIFARLEQLTPEEVEALEKRIVSAGNARLQFGDKEVELQRDYITVKRYEKKVHTEEFYPSVIEPSFGIGRIMYSVLEHSFRQREGDEQRVYFALRPIVAPIKCSVLPISANPRFEPIMAAIRSELAKFFVSYKQCFKNDVIKDDSSGSLGRRYARTDAIGIPFGITVDFESESEPWTVTLRYSITMEQIRLKVCDVGKTVADLSSERMSWGEAQQIFPKFEQKSGA
uniref:Glycine--tRNA ligase n=1 Tax=Elaeophora elaphi TaxID=1147741 RepID=A0A158Q6Q8_9BILA